MGHKIKDCLEGGAGTCRNEILIEDLLRVARAAHQVFMPIRHGRTWVSPAMECPHGYTAESGGWFCDDCLLELEAALVNAGFDVDREEEASGREEDA